MRWQLGGNLEPFLAACEYDWLDCPLAFLAYLWSEIVTDVADCLANETILWRILAVLLVCATAGHLVYWNLRWLREIRRNRDNLKRLEFRAQDLELKVNILTYKAQYGSWPLTYFAKKDFKKSGLVGVQPLLSKFDDKHSWIKHLLISARNKKLNKELLYNFHSRLPLRDCNALELKPRENHKGPVGDNKGKYQFIEQKFSEPLILENNSKLHENYSKKACEEYAESNILGTKKNVENSKTLQFESHYLNNRLPEEKKIIDAKICEADSKLYPVNSDLQLNLSPMKFDEQILSSSTSDTKVTSTHETLYQVKERLENLHMTLRNYNMKESQAAELNVNQNLRKLNDEPREGSLSLHKHSDHTIYHDIINSWNECNYESSLNLNSDTTTQQLSEIVAEKNSTELTKYENREDYSIFENTTKSSQDDTVQIKRKIGKSNIFTLAKEVCTYNGEVNKSILNDNASNSLNNYNEGDRCSHTNSTSVSSNTTMVTSEKSSSAIPLGESDSDEKSTSALVQEALKYKEELLLQIEMKKNNESSRTEIMRKGNESNKFQDLQCTESRFQPKLLDMITEESSETSSMDKKSKIHVLKTQKKKIYCREENKQEKNDNNISINNSSTETDTESENDNKINQRENLLKNDSEISKIESNDDMIRAEEKTNFETKNENKNTSDNVRDVSDLSLDEIEAIEKVQDVISQQNLNFTNSKSDLNSNCLTESSSDTSVNRLIDKVIEYERKCKSARSSLDTKSEKELAIDSLDNFIESHNFFEPVQTENDECDDFLIELNKKKSESENLTDDNCGINNRNDAKNIIVYGKDTENSNIPSVDTLIENNTNEFVEEIFNNQKLNLQENTLKESILTFEVGNRNLERNDEKKCLCTNVEPHYQNCNQMSDGKNVTNENISEYNLHNNKEIIENLDKLFQNGIDVNFLRYNDVPSNQDSLYTLNVDLKDENINITDNISGNFNNDNKEDIQGQLKEEILNKEISKTSDIDLKKSLQSGDTNVELELSTFPCSPRRSKSNSFYQLSRKSPSILHASSDLNCAEENLPKVHKNINSSSFQRHLQHNKQFKAKSNINLALIEKTSPVFAHKRSRSYVDSHDISLKIKKNKVERKNSYELLKNSIRSTSKLYTSRHLQTDKDKIFEATRVNSSESLTSSSKSSLKLQSQLSSRDPFNEEQNNENNFKKNSSDESIASSKSSKSCIPKPKNRLEVFKQNNDVSTRPKSAASSTNVVSSYSTEDKTESKSENEIKNFGELGEDLLISDIDKCTTEERTEHKKESNYESGDTESGKTNISNKRAIVYVNVMTEDDKVISEVINPEQFLQYIQNREIKIQNVTSEKQGEATNIKVSDNQSILPEQQNSDLHNSISDSTSLTDESSVTVLQTQNIPVKLSPAKVEIEILVKPSTVETSTSISDLPGSELSSNKEDKMNKFKIFEVPEELTKEEYIKLLEIVNENPNFEQLSNINGNSPNAEKQK